MHQTVAKHQNGSGDKLFLFYKIDYSSLSTRPVAEKWIKLDKKGYYIHYTCSNPPCKLNCYNYLHAKYVIFSSYTINNTTWHFMTIEELLE
jgi:hypothetical protein